MFAKNENWHINTENLNTVLYTEHCIQRTMLIAFDITRIYFAFVYVSNHYFAIWFPDDPASSIEGSGYRNTVACAGHTFWLPAWRGMRVAAPTGVRMYTAELK